MRLILRFLGVRFVELTPLGILFPLFIVLLVPILAGGRISGKAGAFNVGVLNMQTREVNDVVPGNNFTVARVYRELPNRSRAGVIFVNRAVTGLESVSGVNNQTYGADGNKFGHTSQDGVERFYRHLLAGFASARFLGGQSGVAVVLLIGSVKLQQLQVGLVEMIDRFGLLPEPAARP